MGLCLIFTDNSISSIINIIGFPACIISLSCVKNKHFTDIFTVDFFYLQMYILNMKKPSILTSEDIFSQNLQHVFSESFLYKDTENISLHSHEFLEIGITISGSARHHAENHQTTLTKGSVYLIPAGIAHEITSINHWHVNNIYLLPNSFSNELSIKKANYNQLQYFISKYGHQSQILEFQLRESNLLTVEELLRASSVADILSQELKEDYVKNCLINILILICEDFLHLFGDDLLYFDKHLPRITAMIHENLELPVSQVSQIISETLSLHPQHINRIVKKNLAISISQYILTCKIEKSIQLLSTDLSITEIAHSLGFYDHSHFYKYFTRHTGISPLEYQKTLMNP